MCKLIAGADHKTFKGVFRIQGRVERYLIRLQKRSFIGWCRWSCLERSSDGCACAECRPSLGLLRSHSCPLVRQDPVNGIAREVRFAKRLVDQACIVDLDPIANRRVWSAQANHMATVVDAFKANGIEPGLKTLTLQFRFDRAKDVV